MNNLAKGSFGENLAAKVLTKNGYEVVGRNWHCRYGEIDLITKKDNVFVFVEVKYRISGGYRNKFPIITKYKLRKLRMTINVFLDEAQEKQYDWRLAAFYIFRFGDSVKVKFCLVG